MWYGYPFDFTQGILARVHGLEGRATWKAVPQTQNQYYLYQKDGSAVNKKRPILKYISIGLEFSNPFHSCI